MTLFVVYSIETSSAETEPVPSGGKVKLIRPWDIDTGTLQPLGYSYSVPQ
jgi:hypothetical protein